MVHMNGSYVSELFLYLMDSSNVFGSIFTIHTHHCVRKDGPDTDTDTEIPDSTPLP